MTAQNWTEQASRLSIDGRAFIVVTRVSPQNSNTSPLISPATLQPLTELFSGTPQDVDNAVAQAREAFETGAWSNKASNERGEVLIKLADLLLENLDELALVE